MSDGGYTSDEARRLVAMTAQQAPPPYTLIGVGPLGSMPTRFPVPRPTFDSPRALWESVRDQLGPGRHGIFVTASGNTGAVFDSQLLEKAFQAAPKDARRRRR